MEDGLSPRCFSGIFAFGKTHRRESVVYSVSYQRASEVAVFGTLAYVFLAAMARKQAVPKPWLFRGQVAQPLLFRDALLSLQDVVAARYYRPDLWRYLDPVVTVAPECVRLECFSSDAGVYARVDLDPEVFHEGELGSEGTTNIDFGAEFAASLGRLRPGRDAALEVGEDSVKLETAAGTAVERKVKLPESWVRGFLQVQAIQRAIRPGFSLGRAGARLLLNGVPPRMNEGETRYVTPTGKISVVRPSGEALEVAGLHRLRLLKRLSPHLQRLSLWAAGDCGPTFWLADLGCARMTLGLSSAVSHTFSGDGEALFSTRREPDPAAVQQARALLTRSRIDAADLAGTLGVSGETAGQILDLLGEQGLVGYDLARSCCYPRHLPYLETEGFQLQPRDVNSRRLLERQQVELETRAPLADGEVLTGWVRGDHGTYRTRATVSTGGTLLDGDCTCAWVLKHGLSRGPCKHILALRLKGEVDG